MTESERSIAPPEGPRERPRRFEPLPEWVGPATVAVHAARRVELNAGAVVPPIYQTSTFHYPAAHSEAAGPAGAYLYSRYTNPTQEVAAELIRALEGGEGARVFASGMGAISTSMLALLRAGDEVVAAEDLYGATLELLSELLPRHGIRVRWVPVDGPDDPRPFLTDLTRLLYLESPTNPLLRVHDLGAWAAAADHHRAFLVVDNTFATPINQRPLDLGADLVVHSATKYLGGHSDLLAGAAVGPRALLDRIDRANEVLGAALDPFAAFLLARGLRTLPIRVQRQNTTARTIVEALKAEREIVRVLYPGEGDPRQEALAVKQMKGRGGVLAFVLRGGSEAVDPFLRRLRLIQVASSLGGVESLASVPGETSHRKLGDAERVRRGISPGLVRLSVGIEEPQDLIRDLKEALASENVAGTIRSPQAL